MCWKHNKSDLDPTSLISLHHMLSNNTCLPFKATFFLNTSYCSSLVYDFFGALLSVVFSSKSFDTKKNSYWTRPNVALISEPAGSVDMFKNVFAHSVSFLTFDMEILKADNL